MQEYEVEALLDIAKDEFLGRWGTEGLARMGAVLGRVEARYPDDPEAQQNAASGALQVALGAATVEEIRDAWLAARRAERAAMEVLAGALTWESEGGVSDSALSSQLGLNRNTVRKAVGR